MGEGDDEEEETENKNCYDHRTGKNDDEVSQQFSIEDVTDDEEDGDQDTTRREDVHAMISGVHLMSVENHLDDQSSSQCNNNNKVHDTTTAKSESLVAAAAATSATNNNDDQEEQQ